MGSPPPSPPRSPSASTDTRAKTVGGELIQMKGYAYYVDETQAGQLMVHLDDVPVDAPYWVLALGDKDGVSLFSLIFLCP